MRRAQRSFEALALPHLDAAYNLARWLCGSTNEADDIVQDAMVRAWRAFDQFRGDDIRPWLLAIVRNCWRNSFAGRRRDHAHVPIEDERALVHDGPDPEVQAVSASEGRRLRAIIDGLPEEFRTALVLREVEDMSYRDIAEATGAPIGAVMSRLARARALLKARWQAEDEHVVR
ncbi:MAG TPA: sigma-70 family RNA polymerase sigma factor [Caulobacteraceae bacterium]|nr:sigma-70 family RNA polymerase sigma factor [Caulobacteraceae bacterium]